MLHAFRNIGEVANLERGLLTLRFRCFWNMLSKSSFWTIFHYTRIGQLYILIHSNSSSILIQYHEYSMHINLRYTSFPDSILFFFSFFYIFWQHSTNREEIEHFCVYEFVVSEVSVSLAKINL